MIALVRLVHGLISLFFLACIAYVYRAGIQRRRGPLVVAAIAALTVEGAVVGVNGGDCPLGGVHHRVGDDRTFFELFMPPRLAKAAVPVLGGVAAVGFLLVLARPPRPPALTGEIAARTLASRAHA